MLKQRAKEMKIHKLIISLSLSFSIIFGYYLLHNNITIYNLKAKVIYILSIPSILFKSSNCIFNPKVNLF